MAVVRMFPELPFNPQRRELYTVDELYDTLDEGYPTTFDARVYAWAQASPGYPGATGSRAPLRRDCGSADLDETAARALHDARMETALDAFCQRRRLVGVMGGHSLPRGAPEYVAAARLAHGLSARGLTVATGGGPGAMEAANLGASIGAHHREVLDDSLGRLDPISFAQDPTRWASSGLAIRGRIGPLTDTLGIPTWFYGHEPPGVFATHHAKYFANSVREATLLRRCDAGVVFLPGAAGTVQEIFADACENYYDTPQDRTPMVLLGTRYWTEDVPVWPLLLELARRADFVSRIRVTDDPAELFDIIGV